MDPVLDRVRAADPVSPGEFDGLADFSALTLEARPRRRRWFALPAVGAVVAALVLVPGSAPQAREVAKRVSAAVQAPAIVYAESTAESRGSDGTVTTYGPRKVWVLGDRAMRWLDSDGDEEVYAAGSGTARFDPRTGKTTREPGSQIVPPSIFQAAELVKSRDVTLEDGTLDGRDVYVLRWSEPADVTIEKTMWVDRETYAPLRYTDHSFGRDVHGKPFETTFVETVREFRALPDTPENRRLLELSKP